MSMTNRGTFLLAIVALILSAGGAWAQDGAPDFEDVIQGDVVGTSERLTYDRVEVRPELTVTAGGLEQALSGLESSLDEVEALIEDIRGRAYKEDYISTSHRYLRYRTTSEYDQAQSKASGLRAKLTLMKAQMARVASYFDTRGMTLEAETLEGLASAYARVVKVMTRYNGAVFFGRETHLRYNTVKPFDEQKFRILDSGVELVRYPRFSPPPAFGKHSFQQSVSDIGDGAGGRQIKIEQRLESSVVRPTRIADANAIERDLAQARKALDEAAQIRTRIEAGAENLGRELRYDDESTFEDLASPAISFRTKMTHALAALNAARARVTGIHAVLTSADAGGSLEEVQTRYDDLAKWGQKYKLNFDTNALFNERSYDLLRREFTSKLRFFAAPIRGARTAGRPRPTMDFGRGTGDGDRPARIRGGDAQRPMKAEGLIALVRAESSNADRRNVAVRNFDLVYDLDLQTLSSIARLVSSNAERRTIFNAGLAEIRARMNEGFGGGEPITSGDLISMASLFSSNDGRRSIFENNMDMVVDVNADTISSMARHVSSNADRARIINAGLEEMRYRAQHPAYGTGSPYPITKDQLYSLMALASSNEHRTLIVTRNLDMVSDLSPEALESLARHVSSNADRARIINAGLDELYRNR